MKKKLSDTDIIKNSFGWTPSRFRDFNAHNPEDSGHHRLLSADKPTKPF